MLATIVGSANGRSMSALTMLLPGNWSRTSTQAISVPITTLMTATTTETSTVMRSESMAAGAVMASQNPDQPSSNEVTVRAASGSGTMMLSQRTAVAMPSGPTEPVTRSHDQVRPAALGVASSEPPGAGACPIPALLLSVTIVQYPA